MRATEGRVIGPFDRSIVLSHDSKNHLRKPLRPCPQAQDLRWTPSMRWPQRYQVIHPRSSSPALTSRACFRIGCRSSPLSSHDHRTFLWTTFLSINSYEHRGFELPFAQSIYSHSVCPQERQLSLHRSLSLSIAERDARLLREFAIASACLRARTESKQ